MKGLQLIYKSLTIIIVMLVFLVVAGCSNTSQPDKQNSIKLSEVVGDKITIRICNRTISIPKKPITMIRSFIASNPPGYQSVEVSLTPVDEVYLHIKLSEVNKKQYDAFSPSALVSIYCDYKNNHKYYSTDSLELIKVIDLPDLGLSEFKVGKPRLNFEKTYFFPIDAFKSSEEFYFTCEPSNYNKGFDSCEIRGAPITGIGMDIKFSDIRDWKKYKQVFESLIAIEEK